MIRRIEKRQLLHIMVIFLLVQLGGFFLASLSLGMPQITSISSVSSPQSATTALFYAAYIVLAAALLIVILRIYHGDILFRIIEGVVVVVASFFVFLIVILFLVPGHSPTPASMVLALLLAIALIAAKNRKPVLRNPTAIISSIGVGVILGFSFSFTTALLLMLIIAAYDYIAVFITKHMVTMANAISSRNLAFLVGVADVEAVPRAALSKKEAAEYTNFLKKSSRKNDALFKSILKSGRLPMVSQVQLGAGDLGLPLMLAISAYTSFLSAFAGIVIIIGGSIGLLATMFFLKRYQRPLPAIPPIFSFISMAIGVGFFAKGIIDAKLALLFIVFGAVILLFSMVLTLGKRIF